VQPFLNPRAVNAAREQAAGMMPPQSLMPPGMMPQGMPPGMQMPPQGMPQMPQQQPMSPNPAVNFQKQWTPEERAMQQQQLIRMLRMRDQ